MKTKRHIIYVENPDVSSMASLVCLTREYAEEELRQWLAFRNSVLDEHSTENGTLECSYCGLSGLLRDPPVGCRRYPANLATVDHVVPVSKGGGRYDRGNCVIACYACNQKKADVMPDEWEQGTSDV